MEVREIILARAIRLVKLSTAAGYWPDIFEELAQKYSFVGRPDVKDVVTSQESKGAEFKHGKMRRPDGSQFVITQLVFFNDGIVVDAQTSTDDCDVFLDEIQHWGKAKAGIGKVGSSIYLSQMEVSLDINRGRLIDKLRQIGERISSLMNEYGSKGITPYWLHSLALKMEPGTVTGAEPSPFLIERRLNEPFSENVFFAQAPLRTKDHRAVLTSIEEALATT